MQKVKPYLRALAWSCFLAHATLAHAATPGLDVNDVSFLFPLKNGQTYPALSLAADDLLNASLFEQVLHFEFKDAPIDHLPYNNSRYVGDRTRWLVTSLRFDPCGDTFVLKRIQDPARAEPILEASPAHRCQARLRVVAQPLNFFGGPNPTAMHILYNLEPSEAQAFVANLQALKAQARETLQLDTTGMPLMLHPALAAEAARMGLNAGPGPLAQALRAAVLGALAKRDGAPSDRIETITLIVEAAINHWRFVGGHVERGVWTRFVTEFSRQLNPGTDPTAPLGVEDLACDINPTCVAKPNPPPGTLSPAGTLLSEIFQDAPEWRQLQVPGHRSAETRAKAELIDQPTKTHFFSTNCVSCHQSSNLRDREAFLGPIDTPSGITPFVPKRHLNPFVNNVLNFGYFGTSPRISTRTAAESAAVADQVNRELGAPNPAPVISDLEKFWKCLTTQSDWRSCR